MSPLNAGGQIGLISNDDFSPIFIFQGDVISDQLFRTKKITSAAALEAANSLIYDTLAAVIVPTHSKKDTMLMRFTIYVQRKGAGSVNYGEAALTNMERYETAVKTVEAHFPGKSKYITALTLIERLSL